MERKEAIEIVRSNFPNGRIQLSEALKTLIPELKESEDERISREITEFLVDFNNGEYENPNENTIDSWLSWLEKQQDNTNIEQVFRPLAGCCIDTAAKQAIEQQKIGKNVVLAFNGCYIPVENNTVDAIVNKYNAWVEKQGEQKPNPYSGITFEYNGHTFGMCARDNGVEILLDAELKAFVSLEKSFIYPIHPQPELVPKSALEVIKEEKVDNANKVEPKDYNIIDPHFAKPIDKVEPKFKVCDWIIKNNDSSISVDYSICKITNAENGNYAIESIYGHKGYNTFETFEKDYHLWTIADAKDGDVLVAPNGTIFLFKNIINSMPYSYCGIDCTARFRNTILEGGKDGRNWTSSLKGIYPATKEQRNLLFQKMKEAGYILE